MKAQRMSQPIIFAIAFLATVAVFQEYGAGVPEQVHVDYSVDPSEYSIPSEWIEEEPVGLVFV